MLNTKKNLVIVCDEKTEKYANYLRQLISTKDDKDGEIVGVADDTVTAVVWTDKEYQNNKATISSNEHVLFIGDSKVCKAESSSMVTHYEKFGMKYGWLGKRAFMIVDKAVLSEEDYDQFIEYCLSYQPEFERIIDKTRPKKKDKIETKEPLTVVEVDADTMEVKDGNDSEDKKQGLIKKGGVVVGGVALAAAGGIAGALGGLVGIGVGKGIKKIHTNNEVRDQQYRALTSIIYMEGLTEFMEG